MPAHTSNEPRLAAFSAATLHEACERSRVLPASLRPVWPGASLRGPAFPVAQEAGHNARLHRAIYEAPPGSVIVAITGDAEFGYWGELMARAALERALAGLVIDGGVRDVAALESLGFPVFAARVCMRGTGKGGGAEPSPASVELGGVRVSRGDLVVGDRDGVVVLPADDLEETLERAEARTVAEDEIREALTTGRRLWDLVMPSSASSGSADRASPSRECALPGAAD